MSQFNSIFNQIFNEEFKTYKQFYDLTTWCRRGWDATLDYIFNNVIDALKDKLPAQKKVQVRLLRPIFFRSVTPQTILKHFCHLKKFNNPSRYFLKCDLCSPVYFFPFGQWYFESFAFGLSDVEKRIARNLFNDPSFSVFGKAPSWFRTLNYQAMYLMSRSYFDI